MNNYKILTLKDKEEWNNDLKKLPTNQQDIYYTPEYYSLYEKYGDGKAICFIFSDGKEYAVYPFLKNSINKLGYILDNEYFDIQGAYGYNGVVSSSYQDNFINKFYSAFNNFCFESNIIAEFTRFNPIIQNQKFSQRYIEILKDRETVIVDLYKNIDDIRYDFSSPTKRAIKKAQKNKLYPRIFERSYPFKEEFIKIYQETMQRVNSIEYLFFNQTYFNDLFNFENFIQFIIEHKDIPIASSLCLYSNQYFHYHLGASKGEFLKLRPNDLLFEEMIKYAKLKNCRYIHFGGGNTNNENDGLFKFKKGFSKDYLDFYIGKKIHNNKIYKKVKKQWETNFPESHSNNKHRLLGYREIKDNGNIQ